MSVLKYKNPNWVEGSGQPKWIAVGSGGSSGGNGDTGGGSDGGTDTEEGYEVLSVSVKAVNADSVKATLKIDGKEVEIESGNNYSIKIAYGTEYTIVPYAVEGFTAPETLTFVAEQEIRIVELEYVAPIITTININQNISDPYSMITMVSDGGAIQKIRENSHRYVGQYDSANKRMVIRQLDDNNGTVYKNGIPAPITQLGNDVFMKLPKFWYKAEEIMAEGIGTNSWNISFAFDAAPDSTWKEWDGKEFIGVYSATVDNEMLYSCSGKTSNNFYSDRTPLSSVKTYASNRGENFEILRWEHYCMITALYFAYYLNTDFQNTIGKSVKERGIVNGETNYLGMNDTDNSTDEETLNIWGIESWFRSNYCELFGNIEIGDEERTFKIISHDGVARIIPTVDNTPTTYVSKLLIGEYLDMVPTEYGASSTTSFCSYSDTGNWGKPSDSTSIYDTIAKNYGTGGIVSLRVLLNQQPTGVYIGNSNTRLCYHGDFIIDE